MTTWLAKMSNHAGVHASFDLFIDIPAGQAGSYNNWRGNYKSCPTDVRYDPRGYVS